LKREEVSLTGIVKAPQEVWGFKYVLWDRIFLPINLTSRSGSLSCCVDQLLAGMANAIGEFLESQKDKKN
jgi:hypothetical protein